MYGKKIRIGQKIGDWKVISKDIKIKRFLLWKCRCVCGFIRYFTTSYLNTGKPTCCDGCKNKRREKANEILCKNQIGKFYGSYAVIKFLGTNRWKTRQWLCRCKCGHERIFSTAHLFGKGTLTKQCRSCHKKESEMCNRITDKIPKRFWKRFMDHSRRRDKKVNVTRKYAYQLYLKQNKKCALTGVEIYFTDYTRNYTKYTTASLDRIDNLKGYIKGNVQWVHKKVNFMKGQLEQEDFIKICCLISKGSAAPSVSIPNLTI